MDFKTYGNTGSPTLLLIPGLGVSYEILLPLIGMLKDRFHVIAVQVDGFTLNSHTEFMSIEDQARQVVEYINESLGGHLDIAYGLSLGGKILSRVLEINEVVIEHAIMDAAPLLPLPRWLVGPLKYLQCANVWSCYHWTGFWKWVFHSHYFDVLLDECKKIYPYGGSKPALTVTWFDFKEYILRFAQNYLTMKKTIPGCRLTTVLMATIFIIATSCVDERYDLTKIDETAVILKDITMPVGNIEPLTIEDFLTVDNFESSLIRPDDKGDFALEFEGSEPITVAVSVPAFDMAFEETGVEGRKVVMRMPSEIAGMDVSMLEKLKPEYYNKHISYEELTGSLVSLRKTVKLNDEFILSHYINDIKEIELNAELMYEFKLAVKDVDNSYVESPKAAMHVEKDFTIDFPDWLSIRKNDDIDAYIVENNANNKNVVRFVKDMYIPAENSIVFDLILNKAEVPAGFLVDGGIDELGRPCKRLEVDVTDENNMILIKGDIYLTPSDFDVVPKELELNMNLSFRNLAVKSALVSLNVSEKIDDLSYALPTVPEMFTRDGVVIDIYDPMMYFNINNQSPLDIKVSACLKTYRNDVELKHMYLSETGRNNPITIPHNFTGRLGISRLGGDGLIANPDIAMLFRTLPDLVKIDDINISVGEDYVRIYPGQSLECTVGYGFNAPLAFGPEFAIDLEYELKDLNLVLDYVGIESARLAFDAVNTIPLSLGVDALVVDADGNEVHDILINIEGSIQAGSLPSPSTSSVSITLNSTAKSINLDNLKLIFKASCPPAYQGVVINKRQGLEIRNLKIGLPEGVLLNLDELLDSEN